MALGGMIWGIIWLGWDEMGDDMAGVNPYQYTPSISSHPHLIFFTLIPQALNVKEWY